ncbi:NAD(P)-dependent oxidoreductase [Microbacterium sp. BR1]|uniref:NAD(P)-dependent oxidoreductase n=1 Tax=Microbacterium sp. BR1 TaxID=1070896 RepID=UPI000C2CA453|nr:NAD(P)-dependent oxidoreductase [Microbacterium sp. BR1]
MAKLVFIGLGTMGAPMTTRLVAAGHELNVSDASPEVARTVAETSGASVADPHEAVGEADAVFLMLPNSDIVAAVLGFRDDPQSLASKIRRGTVVVDMGSSRPDATRVHADDLAHGGVAFVDAPVSGGPRRAETGELSIMVGINDDEVWNAIAPILGALGTNVSRTGLVGSAHALKALNNLLSVIGIVGALEVLTVGTKFGLDPAVMLEVINHSTGRNHATEVKLGPHVLDRQWNVGFSLGLTVKDVTTALHLAESQSVATPVSHAAVAVAVAALDSFAGTPADQSQIAQYIEALNGVTLGRPDSEEHS